VATMCVSLGVGAKMYISCTIQRSISHELIALCAPKLRERRNRMQSRSRVAKLHAKSRHSARVATVIPVWETPNLLTLTRISVEPSGAGSIETRGSGRLKMHPLIRAETISAHAARRHAGTYGKSDIGTVSVRACEISGRLTASGAHGPKLGHGNGNASRIFARSSTWSE
jgi:hypothetical protein